MHNAEAVFGLGEFNVGPPPTLFEWTDGLDRQT